MRRFFVLVPLACGFFAMACTPTSASKGSGPEASSVAIAPGGPYTKPPASELKTRLTPMQFDVTQNAGTEPPFRNQYWDNHESGLYVDIVTGEPLFSSSDKFESGTGWPSFVRSLDAHVVEHEDATLGMSRTEVTARGGGTHLGHVFDDGPLPTGKRYCINSASLRFIPVAKLDAEGYGEYAKLFAHATEGAK